MGIQGTVDNWRKDLLKNFKATIGDDCFRARWLTACDEVVCSLCAAREGKYFTLEELKKELAGEFCQPDDEDDRCRCCFVIDECCFIDSINK